MTQEPPDWVVQVPANPAITDRNSVAFAAPQWTNLDQKQLDALRQNLLQSISQFLVQIFTGGLLPGSATQQLQNWSNSLTAGLNAVLPQSSFQFLINAIAGALGHAAPPGTNYSWTDIETFLGIIPPTNVTGTLGQPSLQQDLTTWATTLYGAPAVQALTTAEQDIAHFITNAITGGNAPTSPNSAVAFLDGLFNAIPHNNVVIPPNPGTGAITHDATTNATPFTGPVTSLITITFNHLCAATANYLTVRLGFYSTYTPIVGVTYNGISVPVLVQCVSPSGNLYSMTFGLPNPPTGNGPTGYQVAIGFYSPLGSSIYAIAAQCDSYIGFGSVNLVSNNNNSGISPLINVSSAANHYTIMSTICEAAGHAETLTPTSPTGVVTQYNSGDIPFTGIIASPDHMTLLGLDSTAGTSLINFAATAANPAYSDWACTAVDLVPALTNPIGSVFRAANTSTSNVSAPASTTNELFPSGFFNTVQSGMPSADLTYSGSPGPDTNNNAVTITMAGSYTITVAVLISATVSNQYVGLLLYQTPHGGSSAIIERGNHQYVYNPLASPSYVVSHTFQLYCSAGDVLQPGYYVSTTGNWFVGTSDGLSTYFKVSLHNRGLLS